MFFSWFLDKVSEMSGYFPFSAYNSSWRITIGQILAMSMLNNDQTFN